MRSRSVFGFDIFILLSTVLLIVIGVLFIYSSGVTSEGEVFSQEYVRQIIWACSGLVLLVGVSILDYRLIQARTLYIYGALLLLLVATLLFGRVVNGARSWIGIGELGVQPSEFAKLATILFLADRLERMGTSIRRLGRFLMGLGIALVPSVLTLIQPDLGTAVVFIPIFLLMAFVAGARLRHIMFVVFVGALSMSFAVLPAWQKHIRGEDLTLARLFTDTQLISYSTVALTLVLLLSAIGYVVLKRQYFYWMLYGFSVVLLSYLASIAARIVLEDYQIMRLIVFLDPYVDPRGAGWNIIQSMTAVGSGGFFGKGFLEGTQSHYQFLPQQSTDFIFSILAEEWGFIGSFAVFVLFAVILLRTLYVVNSANDAFGSYLSAGVAAMLFFHFVVNIGMSIGIMPITGIPLFFVSYGGSSLWTALLSVGLVMSVYQHRYRY
jgi:rod shape determining protein RodA